MRTLRMRISRNAAVLSVLGLVAFVLLLHIQTQNGSMTQKFLNGLYIKLYGPPGNSQHDLIKAVEKKKQAMRRPDAAGRGDSPRSDLQMQQDMYTNVEDEEAGLKKQTYCNVYKPDRIDESFVQTNIRTGKGLQPIFVHDMADEVSRSLMQSNTWEAATVSYVDYTLQNDGSMHLIDLGANLGVYTITAASLNRHVVAVEPNLANAKRLRKTVLENKMANLVTIVLNALSDRHETVRVASQRSNVGGGKIVRVASDRYPFFPASDNLKNGASAGAQSQRKDAAVGVNNDGTEIKLQVANEMDELDMSEVVFTITMNDLLEVITFDRAILKMDIEGSEAAALRHADELFARVDIPIVLFEWATRSDSDAETIRRFFFDRGFAAYTNPYSDAPLLEHLTWPWEIVWRRSNLFNEPRRTIAPTTKRIRAETVKQPKHCNIYDSEVRENFPLTVLHTALGECGIYTYDSRDSISHSLMTTGVWESNQISHLLFVLGADPQMQLIDIGCNLGVYTLVAAMRGRQVVAVDANVANLRRLRKSLWLNHYEERVTVVWNAITDHRGDSVKLIEVDRNIGGSFIVPRNVSLEKLSADAHIHFVGDTNKGTRPAEEDKEGPLKLTEQSVTVETITMDDLLEVTTFQRAVLKIDIEGDEVRALRGASLFFDTLDIPIVYFEWGVTFDDMDEEDKKVDGRGSGGTGRSPEERKWILDFFRKRSYLPFADPRHAEPLHEDSDTPWPFDIVFVRKRAPRGALAPVTSLKPAANVRRKPRGTTLKTVTSGKTVTTLKATVDEALDLMERSRVKPTKLWNVTVLPTRNVSLSVEERFLFRPLTLKVFEFGTVKVYGFYEPDVISNSLAAASEWETLQLHAVVNVLRSSRNLHLIDIGCNIGTYTLAAAKVGRRVLAVDAYEASLLRVRTAVIEQGFEQLVTLVHNAISDNYVRMRLIREPGNIGGNRVWPLSPFYNVTKNDVLSRSVLLDDLVELLATAGIRKALLKMDIEGHEVQALRFAERLFNEVRIPVVFIEWGKIVTLSSGSESEVLQFMRRHSYVPYAYYDATVPLPETAQWPWNVVWKKNDSLTPVMSSHS